MDLLKLSYTELLTLPCYEYKAIIDEKRKLLDEQGKIIEGLKGNVK